MKTPHFWDVPNHFLSRLLKPFGAVYAFGTASRFRRTNPYQVSVPVICVGNLSVGGTGKTPVCLAVAELIRSQNKNFYFLNHGYKAKLKNVQVEEGHRPDEVGDEAILLAHYGPTIVDNHRARGAQLAVKKKAECIIMDDGFQNPTLIKTLSFVVVDGKRGFGNECVMPAGPLREPVLKGLERADCVVIAGDDEWGVRFYMQRNKVDLPVLSGHFQLNPQTIQPLKGKKVMAFAGIGQPTKFFDILKKQGIDVVKTETYPDHYYYTRFDIDRLIKAANGLPLVTTSKDAVKISKDLLKQIQVIDGKFVFDNPQEALELIKGVF